MPKALVDRIEQRQQTRGKLVEAAMRLFSTSGYEHATVDDISQAAGYSKGAYYFHFSTKDDVLLELLRIWSEARIESLAAAGASDETPLARLEAMLEMFYSYEDDTSWPAVLLEFWSQAVRNPEVAKRLSATYGGFRRQIADAVGAAIADGSLRISSADEAASVLLAAHDGYAVQLAIGSPGAKAMSAADLVGSLIKPLTEREEGGGRRVIAI